MGIRAPPIRCQLYQCAAALATLADRPLNQLFAKTLRTSISRNSYGLDLATDGTLSR
jgi:hypothetical protein